MKHPHYPTRRLRHKLIDQKMARQRFIEFIAEGKTVDEAHELCWRDPLIELAKTARGPRSCRAN